MTEASREDFTEERGDSWSKSLTFSDANGAVDITGWTIFFTLKESPSDDDANALITKDVTSHTDPTNGTTAIELDPTDLDIESGRYHYDMQYKDSGGNVETFLKGQFTVLTDVTRRTS